MGKLAVALATTHQRAFILSVSSAGLRMDAFAQIGNLVCMAMGTELLNVGQLRSEVLRLMCLDFLKGWIAAVAIDAIDALLIVNVLFQGVQDDVEAVLGLVFRIPQIDCCMTLDARVVVVDNVRTLERWHFQRRLLRCRRRSGHLVR